MRTSAVCLISVLTLTACAPIHQVRVIPQQSQAPGVRMDGRAQMLDMYALHYRGVEFLVMTKALVLSDTIRTITTRVTATTPAGKPIDNDASADLLALLEEQLPAAIIDVQARFRAEGT